MVSKVIAVGLVAVGLSGCVQSQDDAFVGRATATPLPDKFLATTPAYPDLYQVERDGNGYRFADGSGKLFFYPITETTFVEQVVSADVPPAYAYNLAVYEPGAKTAQVIDASSGDLAEKLGIPNPNGDSHDAYLENADDIIKVLVAAQTAEQNTIDTYQILDFADPADRMQAKHLLQQHAGQ